MSVTTEIKERKKMVTIYNTEEGDKMLENLEKVLKEGEIKYRYRKERNGKKKQRQCDRK